MRSVIIGPLQLCVGLYCIALGALMLITPHQFLSRSFVRLQPYLGWWGSLFLLAGCLLFGAALIQFRKPSRLAIHLFAGSVLLSLAYSFTVTQAWSGIGGYLILGLSTAFAPLMLRPQAQDSANTLPPIDLFTLTMGVAGIVLGLMMLVFPDQFRSAIYQTIQPYLYLHGLAFLIGGLLLIWAQLRVPQHRNWVAVSHIVGGAAFLAFCITAAIPARSLSAIAFYGGLGLSVLFLPWLSAVFSRIDPTRLQTRLALALIALSAIPLVLSLAVISEREAYTATQQTLARERLLARNLARSTHTFVSLHQAATELLAQEISRTPQDTAANTQLLADFQQAYPDFRHVLTYDTAGELIARSGASTIIEFSTQPAVFAAVQTTLEPQIAVGANEFSPTPVFTIGVPLLSSAGDFSGLLIGVLDSAQLAQMWIESAQIAEGEVYLVDDKGQVIASPNAVLFEQSIDRSAIPPVVAALSEQRVGSLIYTADNGSRLSSYAPVPDLPWSVIIDRPTGAILSGLRAGQDLTIGILLMVVIIATLMSVLLARTLSIPLTMLTRATQSIARSEYEQPTPLPQSSVYEVATLSEQFAALRTSLQQRTAERDRAEQHLQLLADAGSALATSLDAEMTLQQITQLMVPALGDWGLIYLAEADGAITLAASTHADPNRREITEALYSRYPVDPNAGHGVANVLRTGRPEVITEITDELLAAGARDEEHLRLLRLIGFNAVMVVPMNARGVTLGVLVVVSASPERTYDADDLALAEDLAQRAALAAANASLYTAERTARREAEAARTEAEMALGARDQFLSIAAHELRTPLTALLGQAQLMERRIKKYPEINERDRRALSVVVGQAQRLDQLITTLFDLNRLQTGQITLQCAPCDLGEFVERLAEELQPTLTIHRFELDLPAEPVIIDCDQLRMDQILQNLIQNAIKYSPDGGVVGIRIAVNDTTILLEVRDEGIGIPEESLPHLFEPYFRASNAERSVMQGLGVGLGIVKELVQLHGGTVSVTSTEGQGSTFTIRLPYALDQTANDQYGEDVLRHTAHSNP